MNERLIVRAGNPGTEFKTGEQWLHFSGSSGGPGRRTPGSGASGLTCQTVKTRG